MTKAFHLQLQLSIKIFKLNIFCVSSPKQAFQEKQLDLYKEGCREEDIDLFLAKGDVKTDGGACGCRGSF